MYPDAKFIHIFRNPVTTYLSTYKFYISLLPTTALEKYQKQYIKDKIIQNYKLFMQDYLDTKHLIPAENLYEIQFEEFDKDNLGHMKEIYDQLQLDNWDEAKPYFSSYISKQKHYKKNKHKIKKSDLDTIKKEWGFAMKEFDYEIPDNLDIL